MEQTVLLLGGDRRQTFLARRLRELGRVDTLAVPDLPDSARPGPYDLAVLPSPCLDPSGRLRTAGEGLALSVLAPYLGPGTHVFGGALGAAGKALEGRCAAVTDLLADPAVTAENARLTAEAALILAAQTEQTSVFGRRVLVLGFGRIGGCLTRLLLACGAEITVTARREASRAAAAALGCEACPFEACPARQELVFNTVPTQTLTPEQLERLGPDCLWVELASAPGGLPEPVPGGLRLLRAGGLPGKLLPRSAADVLYAGILRALPHGRPSNGEEV